MKIDEFDQFFIDPIFLDEAYLNVTNDTHKASGLLLSQVSSFNI